MILPNRNLECFDRSLGFDLGEKVFFRWFHFGSRQQKGKFYTVYIELN